MRFKNFLAGAMVAMMSLNMMCFSADAAENKNTVDYQALSAKYDKTIYNGNDLGATYSNKSTTFKVWSPSAKLISVALYATGTDKENGKKNISTTPMVYDEKTGVWSVKINGDLKNKYYTYIVNDGKNQYQTVDIYAKAAGANGNRGMIVDLNSTNPEGWQDDKHVLAESQTDAIIWEVHVKDFSYSSSSGVSEKNRGKYLAFTETGTTLDGIEGNPSTGIDYLKKLGITHVQINPFYDFGSVDETGVDTQYNWGYDPKNYNVPEGSYSSNPYDGNVRIKECKQMIKALHDAGIGVIMDVVYNHTYENENSWFYRTVPNYYHRMNSDGTWSNGSGCGNDTASEHKMMRKYIVDSVVYWATEYHIDGFRFDLMGLHDVETMNAVRKALDKLEGGEKILMYGEAWNMATSADKGTQMANQSNMSLLNERIGAFNDTMRDALKGSVFNPTEGGFLQNGSKKSSLKIGIEGQSNPLSGWAKSPTQTVTYSSCHDNYTLYDKLVSSVYGKDSDYRKRYENLVAMNKLNGAAVMTSQGIAFILAGEELARSKDGDENSYKSAPELNMIDWKNVSTYSDVYEYYRGLIEIRKSFSPFTDSTNESAKNIRYIENVPNGVVAYTLADTSDSDGIKQMAVILNGSDNKENVTIQGDSLPSGWIIVANNDLAGLRNLGNVGSNGTVEVAPHSAVILADKDGFNALKNKSEEGVVVAKFYDSSTNELVNTHVITGKSGDSYSLQPSNSFIMNYDVLTVSGDVNGKFTDGVKNVTFKCKKYEGKFSSVTFKFVDAETEKSLCDDITMTNREGQQYFTPILPSIKNYALDLDNLPESGAGKFKAENITVTYKYKKAKPADDKSCVVNAIHMDDNGKILDKQTTVGVKGKEYTVGQGYFDGLTAANSPSNSYGTFDNTETNIIFSYASASSSNGQQIEGTPDSTRIIIISLIALACFATGGGVLFSVLHSRKKSRLDSLDIED